MTKVIFLVVLLFNLGSIGLQAQTVSAVTSASARKHVGVAIIHEDGHDIVRFFNQDGIKTTEIKLAQTEVTAKLPKNISFNPATFGLKISSSVAEVLMAVKKNGRGVEVMRRIWKEAYYNRNKKYLIVREHRSDFVDYLDSEGAINGGESVEDDSVNTVYSIDGSEILKLSQEEGDVSEVSNTGKCFLIITGDRSEKIMNAQKETLVEISLSPSAAYFSDNDRYVILDNSGYISVFDTKEKKLELWKLSVSPTFFQRMEEMDISEENREMKIQYIWDPKKQEKPVSILRF